MNILFLAREIPYPANTGVKMRAWLLLKQLAKKHQITLICFAKEQEPRLPGLLEVCQAIHIVKPKEKPVPFLQCIRMFFGLFSKVPFAVAGRFSREYDSAVKKILKDKKFDLIVCDSLYQAVYIPERHYKILLNEHNIESVIIRRYADIEHNLLKKMYAGYEEARMKRFEDKLWRSVALTLVCSDIDRSILKKRSDASRVETIANGVDTPPLNAQHEGPFDLIYTGLIGWRPNQDAVLYFAKEIYPFIKLAYPQVHFSIVGKGPSRKVKQLKNEGSITVTGAVEKIEPYIHKAAVVIVPLRIGSGTRLKILEALAMGKPVVSTSVGCEGLEVTHGKNILIADEPEDFANAVNGLLKDPVKRKELGENGRLLVEAKYSYEVIGKQIESVIGAM